MKSTVFKSITENKTTICSLLSRHFYYWAADGYLASVFIVSPPGIHISLGICVWGYTYHCDTGTKWFGQSGVESMQGNADSRIKKFLLLESGILSFGTSRTIRIQNSNFTDKNWNLVQLYLESGIHGVESRIHDCLGASAWLSIGMSWVRFLRSDQLKYHVARNLLGF